jgi:hypothetical protein
MPKILGDGMIMMISLRREISKVYLFSTKYIDFAVFLYFRNELA